MALSLNKFLGNHSADPPGSKQLLSSNVQGSTVEQPTLTLPSFADLLPKSQVANSSTYASITGRSTRKKSPPRKEYSLLTSDKSPLIFKASTAAHSVFYSVPKRLQSLQPLLHSQLRELFPVNVGLGLTVKPEPSNIQIELALASATDCERAATTPIVVENHIFKATLAYSSENILHKINLTDITCASDEYLKSRLQSTFERFGIVKDIVLYHDDISHEWFTGNGHVYLEIPRNPSTELEPLEYRISLSDSDTSFLATWARMPDHCRYCKHMGHTKESCDKRPVDPLTSRRIATPSRRTRPDAPLNFNFEEPYSPAAPAPSPSSDGKTGSGLTSQEQSKYSTGAQKDTSTTATKQVSPVATEGSPASKTIDTAASTAKSSTTSATSNIDNDAMDTSEDSSASSNSSNTNPASPGTPGEILGSPPPSTGTEV
ncbi:hypothetical protein G6F57_006353 [Rhizopus arrhizus]|nr:hypothetical protein G6F17_009726 [Rhizopus arrhizus]KAG0934376.1 hypothetical protein G6F30_009844 [Rhizopus arrhizus]KAG0977487.1 hypothetical protein G6F29_010027 [Rhizopus arrhizus]KAG0989099.1 hypothetical protein G6F28_009624 [Rhizopus arrhizus]KAG1010664.1 hypothetical protein G6F27_004443 [Rhizopus arrhizus]